MTAAADRIERVLNCRRVVGNAIAFCAVRCLHVGPAGERSDEFIARRRSAYGKRRRSERENRDETKNGNNDT